MRMSVEGIHLYAQHAAYQDTEYLKHKEGRCDLLAVHVAERGQRDVELVLPVVDQGLFNLSSA